MIITIKTNNKKIMRGKVRGDGGGRTRKSGRVGKERKGKEKNETKTYVDYLRRQS